jgi:hypothetical protein
MNESNFRSRACKKKAVLAGGGGASHAEPWILQDWAEIAVPQNLATASPTVRRRFSRV